MCKQLSLLPLMHQFILNGFLENSTFWETDACKENDYYLIFNENYFSLLLPKDKDDWLTEVVEAQSVVVTKGSYNGKKDCIEIMFYDYDYNYFVKGDEGYYEGPKDPIIKILNNEQFECVTPLKEGWHGHFCIFTGRPYLSGFIRDFEKVYYRVADTLPCGKPIEE